MDNKKQTEVHALILSGGKGIRLGGDIPKQYIEVSDKPVIGYSLDTFEQHGKICGIFIVADESWQDYLSAYIAREHIAKFKGFAPAGLSRTHSILNGLKVMRENGLDDDAVVIVHDAARPNVSFDIIDGCISGMEDSDCAMPAIPVKDTVYLSEDHKTITSLLRRADLCAGQAPESVRLGQYYSLLVSKDDEELSAISGTSAVVFGSGLKVSLFQGSEDNYKITTTADLEKFRKEKEEL